MSQSPYHRVEFNVHNNNQTTSIKLALKPEFTLKDALNQVRNVWTAETKHNVNLAAVNQLSVKDSEGFWLPQDSAINCVLKLNDKVDVFVANNKRKPEQSEGSPVKKAKFDKDSKAKGPKQTSPAKQSTASPSVPGSPVAAKAQDKTQPPKVQSHKGEGKKTENGGQKRKHEEITEKSPEANDNNVKKAEDGNKQGKPDNKGKQADNKKAGQPNAGKGAKSNQHQDKHDKSKKKKGNQAEQNKNKKPEHKAGEKTKQNKQASKSEKKPNANQKKQASLVEKAEPKADNKIDQKTAQKKQKPKAEEEKDVTPKELTEESILNREGQADGGHTEKTKHQQKGELQKESEPSSSLAIEEATATKSKHKKHKAEKHRKHSHDLSAAADQSPEVHTESKKHKKNKRDKKKKEEKDMHRKHSHDISASLEEKTQTDTKSLKKMEKKQKKKEEKARRKSKDLKTDLPVELPSPEDTKLDKRKEEKAKKHNQVEIIASATMAPPVVEAAPKKHKAEKKRKSSLLPIASIVSAEQDAISVESETTGPVAAEIVSEAASPTHSEDMELPEADNFISALFPGSGSASPDTTTTLPTADVSDGPEENMMSSPAEPESSPEVETTLTPTGKEPEISNGTDSGSNTDIEREDSEAPVTPNMEEPGIADVTDSGASSDVAEEDSEAPMAPNMEKPSFGDATDSGANSDVAEEEVDEVEEKNVASSEQLPDDIASYFPSGSTEHTPEPDVDEIEMQASPVVESREISFEPQATSTPIMIDSPDTSSVNEMEIDTQLEQEVMKVEASTIEQDDDVSASQVEESAEVISSQAILPPSDMNVPISQLDIQPSKTEQEDPDSSSSESSSDDDDDAFGFKALKQLEADNLEQPDESYIQTTINILEDISNDTAKPVDVKAVEAATELRKVCDEEFKARLTRAIKNGGETVKSGKEMEQLKAAQLGDEDDSEDHPISGLLPGFMSKSRAPTLSEIYANSVAE